MQLGRSPLPELLDAPFDFADDLAELQGNLRDMARYDRWLGVHDLVLNLAMEGLPLCRSWRGLDLGVGSGDFIRYAAHCSGGYWVGLDRSRTFLCIAIQTFGNVHSRSFSPATHVGVETAKQATGHIYLQAMGEQLPFADNSFDVVTCTHTLHHLDSFQAITLLHECARVAKSRLVVVDLARSYTTLVGAWLLTRLTSRNRMTRADGVQSARRAYTADEASALAQAAGLIGTRVRVYEHGPTRFSLTWQK